MSKIKKVRIDIKRDSKDNAEAVVSIDGQFFAGAYGKDYLQVVAEAAHYAQTIAPEWESGEPW